MQQIEKKNKIPKTVFLISCKLFNCNIVDVICSAVSPINLLHVSFAPLDGVMPPHPEGWRLCVLCLTANWGVAFYASELEALWEKMSPNAADVMHGFTSSAWTSSLCVAEDYVFGHWEHMHVCCMGLLLWPAAANICVAWVYFFDHNQQLPWLATRSNSCVAWAYFCGH